jgi:hypothetical protein
LKLRETKAQDDFTRLADGDPKGFSFKYPAPGKSLPYSLAAYWQELNPNKELTTKSQLKPSKRLIELYGYELAVRLVKYYTGYSGCSLYWLLNQDNHERIVRQFGHFIEAGVEEPKSTRED